MKPRHDIEMKIVLNTEGDISVSCSQLNDLIFCLGLLENSKLAVIDHSIRLKIKKAQDEAAARKIVTPEDLLKKGKI